LTALSRREREIMDALFAIGEGDVDEVRARLADPPGYDSVRTTLRILETKGHVRRRAAGRRHIYAPVQDRAAALKTAWKGLVQTFFGGSQEMAAATLLRASERDLDETRLAALLAEIEAAADKEHG
jgi:predicted transcriptional regulator